MSNRRTSYGKKKKNSALTALLTVPCLCIFGVVVVFVIILAASGELKNDLTIEVNTSEESSQQAIKEDVSLSLENSGTLAYTRPTVNVNIDDTAAPIPNTVKELLTGYFTDKYIALGSLEYSPLDEYFDKEVRRGELFAALNSTVLEYEVYLHRSFESNLSFTTAEVDITITDFKISDGSYSINYKLGEKIDFALSDEPSYTVGNDGKAKISSDSGKFIMLYDENAATVETEEYVMTRLDMDPYGSDFTEADFPEKTDISKTFASVLEQLTAAVDASASDRKKQAETAADAEITVTAENEYDRDAAVAYSYQWTDKTSVVRNKENYSDYSGFGGNCQNFVSQCLHESGIPMDSKGTYDKQWKWYDDELNYKETAKGRVPSWSDTYSFYQYCLNNTDVLVTVPDANLYTGEPGDIIQYSVNGYTYHSVIITQVVKDSSGNIIDYLVNSNTSDKVDYPMSAYGYSDIRLIKVIGSN